MLEVPPVQLTTVPGFDTAVFPYTTDIPFLANWGEPLLFGPGSIHVAHTADEFVSIAELEAAAGHYVTLANSLLACRAGTFGQRACVTLDRSRLATLGTPTADCRLPTAD